MSAGGALAVRRGIVGEATAVLQASAHLALALCRWSHVESSLQALQAAADWKQAEVTGRVVPAEVSCCARTRKRVAGAGPPRAMPARGGEGAIGTRQRQAQEWRFCCGVQGVNAGYDEALASMAEVERELQAYLAQVRGQVTGAGAREVQYVTGKQSKESHVVEVPEHAKVSERRGCLAIRSAEKACATRCQGSNATVPFRGSLAGTPVQVPRDFTLVGQRKGYKRFTSARLTQLCADLAEAEQGKETALANILQVRRERGLSTA